MITRIIAVVSVALLGAAAPARAWCEASCQDTAAHSEAAKPHCPTHEPAGPGMSLSASVLDDCPVLESARPTVTARIDLHPVSMAAGASPGARLATDRPAFLRPHGVTNLFERCTPLRI